MSDAPRYRITMSGPAGPLDTIEGNSEPDCLRQLADKIQSGDWFFSPGDTITFTARDEEEEA